MKYLITLLILPTLLFGAKILSYNVYDRNDRVDVMLTFDTPYEGILRQSRQGNTIIVKLEEAFMEVAKIKNVNSRYLSKLTLAPQGERVEVIAQVADDVMVQASKTSDAYGIRLRFSIPAAAGAGAQGAPVDETALSALGSKTVNELGNSYWIVIGVVLAGIIILLLLKRNIAKKAARTEFEEFTPPWTFGDTPSESSAVPLSPAAIPSEENDGVRIRFQKKLDATNSVAMLDYGHQSYLVLLGNNTVLLDKFQDNVPITQNEFETLLQSRHRELDRFFQLGAGADEPFDSYKEKASGGY